MKILLFILIPFLGMSQSNPWIIPAVDSFYNNGYLWRCTGPIEYEVVKEIDTNIYCVKIDTQKWCSIWQFFTELKVNNCFHAEFLITIKVPLNPPYITRDFQKVRGRAENGAPYVAFCRWANGKEKLLTHKEYIALH